MKMLPLACNDMDIIPINIIYHDPSRVGRTYVQTKEKDILYITFKDQSNGTKFVHAIPEPKIEMYIVKPEHRTFSHMRDMLDMDKCYTKVVSYKSRWAEAAKELKLNGADEAKRSPYVFNIDIPIETWYLMQFTKEYKTETIRKLSIGKLDIESDIVSFDGKPGRGEAPINAFTYVDMNTRISYTCVLLKSHLPQLPPTHRKYEEYLNLQVGIEKQMEYVVAHPEEIVNLCHNKFDELHPAGYQYDIKFVDDEKTLIEYMFKIIHMCENDFIGIWNMPYDMGEIFERMDILGMNYDEHMKDTRHYNAGNVFFQEDMNPVFHKKKHSCISYTLPVIMCDLVNYAGIRAAQGALESLRLSAVAQKELKDDKFDYSEVSDFKYLYYKDLIKFILYNIKDVLLLAELEDKNSDTSVLYSRMYQMAIFSSEFFTSTKIVWHSLIQFMNERGIVHGTNRNKGKKDKVIIDYSRLYGSKGENVIKLVDLVEPIDAEIEDIELDDENIEDKNEKYPGALVLATEHMKPTGVEIMGVPSQFVHDNVADLDIKSEYPSGIMSTNTSNETLVGKVYLDEPANIDIPIVDGYQFKGEDKEKFRLNKSNYMMEVYIERDWLNFGTLFLGLPSANECLSEIEDMLTPKIDVLN